MQNNFQTSIGWLCCVYVCVKSLKTDGQRANEKRNLTFTKISGETNSCNKMQSGVEKKKITSLLNNKCYFKKKKMLNFAYERQTVEVFAYRHPKSIFLSLHVIIHAKIYVVSYYGPHQLATTYSDAISWS